jgi:hypothetical protein
MLELARKVEEKLNTSFIDEESSDKMFTSGDMEANSDRQIKLKLNKKKRSSKKPAGIK